MCRRVVMAVKKKLPFPLEYYDEDFTCLKISALHWFIMVFSANGALIFLASILPKVSASFGQARGALDILGFALALPALLVLAAALFRRGDAPRVLQFVWRHGRLLLLAGLGAQLFVDGHELVIEILRTTGRPRSSEFWFFHPLFVYLEVWFFFVVLFSHRIRGAFQTHPAWGDPPLLDSEGEERRDSEDES